MTYEAMEAGLATQIRALSAFSDDQVSLGDWRALGYGHAQVVILEYNAFTGTRHSSDIDTLFTWTVRVHLCVRYTDDAGAVNALRDRRDEIITKILQTPKLGTTALYSMPVRGSIADPEEVEIGGVVFLHEYIDVEIEELVNA